MGWEVEWPTSDNNLLMLPIFPIPRVAAEKFDAKLVIGAKTGRVFGQKIGLRVNNRVSNRVRIFFLPRTKPDRARGRKMTTRAPPPKKNK